ncbi:MAG: prolipoprotein diacylglyceryl transferase, partial [Vicinamibacteraceae bacterium]|nr:prolipoprotein diacylglyceryl transferase [Vicinamibacteraceae bacterium]
MIHEIDPIIATVGGVHLWWYGLSYALGFLNAFLFLRRNRARLGLSPGAVYDAALLLTIGVLIGGRAIVVHNEWALYGARPSLIPALWVGGLATHGLIIGGALGVIVFCALYRQPFRPVLDVLAIAAAVILGCGRIGNFIDGQIVGIPTDLPWGVKFPNADGFRHPVVLYDGLKNFLLVPLLLWVRRRGAPPGRLAALFVLLYAATRIPIDLLREYPLTLMGMGSGQAVNVGMAVVGAILLARNMVRRPRPGESEPRPCPSGSPVGLWARRVAFGACLCFVLAIPSDATRDVPATYGHRHPGLR